MSAAHRSSSGPTPEAIPAFSLTEILGAIALPELLFEITNTDAFSFLAVSAITLAYAWLSNVAKRSFSKQIILFARGSFEKSYLELASLKNSRRKNVSDKPAIMT